MNTLWPPVHESVELQADEAHVWAVRLDRDHGIDELTAVLSPVERQRAGQLRTEELRRRYCVARASLRALLGRYLGISSAEVELTTARNGKPRLSDRLSASGLQFNLAHSHELALVAVAHGCEIGIDVEHLREVTHAVQIVQRYFHEVEAGQIRGAAPATRNEEFLRCWTAKEAILKAIGTGLSSSLAIFQVPVHEHAGQWVELPRVSNFPRKFWLLPIRPAEGYVGAVALAGQHRTVRTFTSNTFADTRMGNV